MLDKKTIEQLGKEATTHAIERGITLYSAIAECEGRDPRAKVLEVIERELRRAYLAGVDAAKDGVR